MLENKIFPGADETTVSRSEYFSWLNNTNEGATAKQTKINLDFFRYLHDEYGMGLDIYALDAGAIDGRNFYGSMKSSRFKKHFPEGFDPLVKFAAQTGIRFGIWGGPDGFGHTAQDAEERIEQMVSLCRKHNFELFKFDAVCGQLPPENEKYFIRMMTECRKYSPDLVLLNHRLDLSDEGTQHVTTFLWEGAETYVDVLTETASTCPHHRSSALRRGLPPSLKRCCEDHGVCLSACLDHWDDELVLQAFNRSLILAPQIYGNPWLLRDDELPKLARLFNLHRRFRGILVNGMILPETYGPFAVSRGNKEQRVITLRNVSWDEITYEVHFNELGLELRDNIEFRKFHPREYYFGVFKASESCKVILQPFTSLLLYAGTPLQDEVTLVGAEYEVIKDVPGKDIVVEIKGKPGEAVSTQLASPEKYDAPASFKHVFEGKQKLLLPENRKIIDLKRLIDSPEDTAALYEATVFAADNNAMEIRSLLRSGETNIPAVKNARDAFFDQKVFKNRNTWDKNLFDDDDGTAFSVSRMRFFDFDVRKCSFRLDLGKVCNVDEIIIKVGNAINLQPLPIEEGAFAFVSKDLVHWEKISFLSDINMHIQVGRKMRYLKLPEAPQTIIHINALHRGKKLDRCLWRASNLFPASITPIRIWGAEFTLDEVLPKSYLAIALNGIHGTEGAWAAAKINGELRGCPDRSVSYQSNNWEGSTRKSDRYYTYYLPLTEDNASKKIEVFVLGCNDEFLDFSSEVRLVSNPYLKHTVTFKRK